MRTWDEAVARREEKLWAARCEAMTCTACSLHEQRSQVVYGTGHGDADILWLGEAPGPHEDETGEPFTGRSGELLTRIIESIGINRASTFLTNIALCRLDDERSLTRVQIEACRRHVETQIRLVEPKVIVALGSSAWRWFQPADTRKMADIRKNLYRWRGILVKPTYHPAFLLRKAEFKRDVWTDVQEVQALVSGGGDHAIAIEEGHGGAAAQATLFGT